jgi:sec-independent protein translocase protein TatA
MPFIGHLPELIIVMVLALLVFGPKRLPEMGNAVGKTIKEFRHTMSEVTEPHSAPTTAPQIEAPAQPTSEANSH